MGALTNVVKRYVPATYKAMLIDSSPYYTIDELQSLADYVQFKLLATIAGVSSEASTYDPLLLEFLGKVTTVKFLPAAIDYWRDQQEQVTTSGTNETESFASRLSHLRELHAELSADVDAEYKDLLGSYPFVQRGLAAELPLVSYDDGGRGILRTPDPQCEPQPGDRQSPAWPWSLPS